jgi:hypothetical protein
MEIFAKWVVYVVLFLPQAGKEARDEDMSVPIGCCRSGGLAISD